MKLHLLSLIILFSSIFAAHADEEPRKQWKLDPQASIKYYVDMGAAIVATASVNQPDGRFAIITTLQDKKKVYRCNDYYTRDFQQNGFACYELSTWFKESWNKE